MCLGDSARAAASLDEAQSDFPAFQESLNLCFYLKISHLSYTHAFLFRLQERRYKIVYIYTCV